MEDGATIRKMPLFNVLASTHGTPPVVLAVHNCSKHLAQGGKKDAEHVARIFMPQMLKVDPKKNKFDLYIIDGDSNVQSAGHVVEACFSCLTIIHGLEHGTSLRLQTLPNYRQLKRVYRVHCFLIFPCIEN